MTKVLINTIPFGNVNRLPLDQLESIGAEYLINPFNRKITEDDLMDLVQDFDIIIAGTEKISAKVMDRAPKLKMISRVGVGLDGVDLNAAKERGITVSYTPFAPSPAIAELTIGLMLTLLRNVFYSNASMHQGKWDRQMGRRLGDSTVGIIGAGRIGSLVLDMVSNFSPRKILVNDVKQNTELDNMYKFDWTTKERIFKEADIISLHVPLAIGASNMITKEELLTMKKDAILINTSRGGVIDESDLIDVMNQGHLASVAIDVFNSEPYSGPLIEIERCILTPHIGSLAEDCRVQMEIEATEEVVRFINGDVLRGEVPEYEYPTTGDI